MESSEKSSVGGYDKETSEEHRPADEYFRTESPARIGIHPQRIAIQPSGAGRQVAMRLLADKRFHPMSAREKRRDEAGSNIAGAPGNKDIHVRQGVRSFARRALGRCRLPRV